MINPPSTQRSWLGVALGLLVLILLVICVFGLFGLYGSRHVDVPLGWGFRGFAVAFAMPFTLIGSLILTQHPRHVIGWLLWFMGFGSALQGLVEVYAVYSIYVAPESVRGGVIAAWVLNWMWVIIVGPIPLLTLVFPDGKLLSPRWRYIFVASIIGLVLLAVGGALMEGPMTSSITTLNNPYAVSQPEWLNPTLFYTGFGFWLFSFASAALSIVLRYLRSEGQRRQQLKWLVYAVTLLTVTSPLAGSTTLAAQILFIAAMFFLPIAVGIAVLHHRLFDIDLIINRTLVYAVVSGLLAILYFGGVTLMQTIISNITGSQSPLAIVASTLGIAALFNPLRRRVQDIVDRRFYRRKYDAEQTIDAFALQIRDEVDMERLQASLLSVIEETMHPEHVSLWTPQPPLHAANIEKGV